MAETVPVGTYESFASFLAAFREKKIQFAEGAVGTKGGKALNFTVPGSVLGPSVTFGTLEAPWRCQFGLSPPVKVVEGKYQKSEDADRHNLDISVAADDFALFNEFDELFLQRFHPIQGKLLDMEPNELLSPDILKANYKPLASRKKPKDKAKAATGQWKSRDPTFRVKCNVKREEGSTAPLAEVFELLLGPDGKPNGEYVRRTLADLKNKPCDCVVEAQCAGAWCADNKSFGITFNARSILYIPVSKSSSSALIQRFKLTQRDPPPPEENEPTSEEDHQVAPPPSKRPKLELDDPASSPQSPESDIAARMLARQKQPAEFSSS